MQNMHKTTHDSGTKGNLSIFAPRTETVIHLVARNLDVKRRFKHNMHEFSYFIRIMTDRN